MNVDDPMGTQIREVMSRNIICVFDDFNVDTVEEILLDRGLSAVPVINNHGRLVGFATMADIVRMLHDRDGNSEIDTRHLPRWGYHELPDPITVAQLMSPIAFQLPPWCLVQEAIAAMASRSVHRVPVVDEDGQLVGILTAGDIVRYVGRGRQAEVLQDGVPCIVPPEHEWRPYDAPH